MTWKKYKKKYPISAQERAVRRRLRLQKLRLRFVFFLLFVFSAAVVCLLAAGKVNLRFSTLNLNSMLAVFSSLSSVVSAYFAAFPPNLYSADTKAKVTDFKRFLPTHFIDIDCQDVNPADDAQQKPVRQSLRLVVWDWLFNPDPQQTKKSFLLLLGDFGTGKTTFCFYLAQEIVTTMRSMDVAVIQLGQESLSLAEKLQKIEGDKRENTVLFLDAYDEYVQRLQGEQEFDNLLKLANNFYKVIITSRTHYFSHKQAEPHLNTRYVSYFSPEQIRRFFKLKYPWRWQRYWNTIKRYENLTDLARRVVLLNYMSREVILWMQEQKSKNVEINTFLLYGKIIEAILPDEKRANELMSRDIAMQVMSILGFHIICCGGAGRLHYQSMAKDLAAILDSLKMGDSELAGYMKNPENLATLADWLTEIRARTFLIRDEPGYYYFAHRSFAEYFAAVFIIKKLLAAKTRLNVNFQVSRIILDLLKEAGISGEGITHLLDRVSPIYRTREEELSDIDVKQMLKKNDYYDRNWNNSGKGIEHLYESVAVRNEKVICDFSTGLLWQQSGSQHYITGWENAKKYVKKLNEDKFAGFDNWRLPTLEEAMSLMEPTKHGDLYIDPIFDSKQSWIWTCDQVAREPLSVLP